MLVVLAYLRGYSGYFAGQFLEGLTLLLLLDLQFGELLRR